MELSLYSLQRENMLTIQQWLQEFVQVTDEELEAIQAIIETTTLNANEAILKQGQVSSSIGLLVKGAVRTILPTHKATIKWWDLSLKVNP
jgi:CRP-like cAMP-binding protein